MASFKYDVRDTNGQINSGMVQAASLTEATSLLRAQGGYVLNVAPAPIGAGVLEKLQSVSVDFGPGLKDIHNFTKQLAVMIKAGINIRDAIAGISQQIENKKFKVVIEQLREDVEAGQSFSDALGKHPKVFNTLYVNMVRASELSGNFAGMLERICDYQLQQLETRSMVRGAMIYPAIIGTMAIVTTIFLLAFVLPKFTALFAGKAELLPMPTVILMAASDFVRTKWYVLVGIVAAGIAGFTFAMRTPQGRLCWDKIKLRIPLFRKMFRALYIKRGLHTMGELVNAGVPMLDTLSITAEVSGNAIYENMWRKVYSAVKEGEKIATPLSQHRLLPQSVVQMISAGEESGKLGEVMRDVAEFYAGELKSTVKVVTSMIEPIMIVIMGALVGFIAMSIILPIFKMSSLAK